MAVLSKASPAASSRVSPEQLVAPETAHLHQHRVTARDEQRDEGEGRRRRLQHRRQQMPFHVMDGDGRHGQRVGQAAGERATHEQCADEARTGRVGNAVDCLQSCRRLPQHLRDERHHLADVIARGQLRHHPAILDVHVHLAVQGVREQATLAIAQRDPRLVTGRFDSQYQHAAPTGCTGCGAPADCPPVNHALASGRSIASRGAPGGEECPGLCIRLGPPLEFAVPSDDRIALRWEEIESGMPSVRIRENEHFDAALRRFKRSCEKAGILTELRRREFYEKPTQERKRKKAAAVKRHAKRIAREASRGKRLY